MVDADGPVYYVISDLHIGGDERLEEVEFLDELLEFLERLEATDEDAELLINGDAFGLWEFTTVEGIETFEVLERTYPALFDQLRRTGENVPITLLPGNHDHELAAYERTSSGSPSTTSTSCRSGRSPGPSATGRSTSSTATSRTPTTASRTGATPPRRRLATTTRW
jgi:hypothetical protein